MHKRLLAVVALLVAAIMLMAACGGDGDGNGDGDAGGGGQKKADGGAASGPLTYTGVDYGFQGPETVSAGKTKITLENEGEEQHQMILVQLLEGKTVDDVLKYIKKQGVSGPPPSWAKEAGGIGPPVQPGESKTGPANFTEAGDYIALCFIPSKKEKGKVHAELGMVYPITVEA